MELKINVNKKMLYKLFIGLILLEIIFVIGYFAGILIPNNKLHTIFNLDGESTIPSWFSSMQLFLIGLIFWTKSLHLNNYPLISTFFYKTAGTGFIYLSADEASEIHEKISNILRGINNGTNIIPHFEGGHGHGFWIFSYFLIGIILAIVFYKDIIASFKHYKRSSIIMISGLSIAILGAVGLEIATYDYKDVYGLSTKNLSYVIEVATEEFFEMFGFSLVLYGAFLMLLDKNKPLSA